MTRQERRNRCGELGHVGATFNPWEGKTWCLCGEVTRPGNVATHDDCCGCRRAHVVIDGAWRCLGEDLDGIPCADA